MAEFIQESPSILQQVDSTKSASNLGGPQVVKLEFPDYTSVLSAALSSGNTGDQSTQTETDTDKATSPIVSAAPADNKTEYKSVLAPAKASKTSNTLPPALSGTAAKIQAYAEKIGVDPSVALRVARHEGLAPGVWQSNVKKNGIREPSYGPFQLLVGGQNGFPTGLGNQFIKKTGLNPADPSTVDQQIEFALDYAKQNGWTSWYGAKAAGVGQWQGIKS